MADAGQVRDAAWPRGWDGHERAQLLRVARWPMREKLLWLEEAEAVAARFAAGRRPPPGPGRGTVVPPG